VFSGLSPREPMWLFISCHSPSPASVPASSRTFSQKQQIGSTSFIHASILRFSGVITAPFSLMECEFYLTGRSCAIGHGLILLSWFVRQEEDRKTGQEKRCRHSGAEEKGVGRFASRSFRPSSGPKRRFDPEVLSQALHPERRNRDILLFQTILVYGCLRGEVARGRAARRVTRRPTTRREIQNVPVCSAFIVGCVCDAMVRRK